MEIRAVASTVPARLQFVDSADQSLATFQDGLPASLDLGLSSSAAKWSLQSAAAGKDYAFQHQGSDGSLRVATTGAPAISTITVEPKADRTLDYLASGPASRVQVQSRWNAGFLDADLTGAPSKFRVESGGSPLLEGQVSTLGTGSTSRAKFFLVPDASTTANRLNPGLEHLAVETGGKAPYLALNLGSFDDASWALPGNMNIDRIGSFNGDTIMVLSSSGGDVTSRARSGDSIGWTVTPSSRAGTVAPLEIVAECTGRLRRGWPTKLGGVARNTRAHKVVVRFNCERISLATSSGTA